MIVVKIELWPGGAQKNIKELGRAYIWNTGKNKNPKRGDYKVAVCKKGQYLPYPAIYEGKATRYGEVGNWPRLSYSIWRLVLRALMSSFPEEK